jgi:hypothetical protein
VRRVAGGLEDHLYEPTHGGCFGDGDVPHPAEASSLSPRATKARAKSSRYVTVAEYLSGLTLDGSGEDAVAHGGAPHHLP